MGSVVNCATYAAGRRVRDLGVGEVSEVIGRDGQFVWIGLHEPEPELLRTVQAEFGLHDLAVEDALRAHQRPKLEEYGESLFVVLRTAQWDAEQRTIVFGETFLFVGPHYIVSVRQGPSLSYAEVRTRCESTPQLLGKGPGFVLYAIMDFVVDHYFPIVDQLEEDVEALEEAIFSGTLSRETTARIYQLKGDLLAFKRAVAPLVEVCNRLVRFDVGLIAEDVRLYVRDVYDHVIRINETIDNLRELLTSALEASLSLVSVRQNEIMKRLGAWAAILAVPTMIAGIYGMNFHVMPELDWSLGYPAAIALMVGACAYLYRRFKREGWL